MDGNFDYAKAMAELEKMASDAQNPATSLDDVGEMVKRARKLVGDCREYLRSLRDAIDSEDENQNTL